jgi:hypothetical protein
MRRRTKFLLIVSVALLVGSLLLEIGVAQSLLRGDASKLAEMDHWQRDDVYMGAGLAPLVWGFAPGVLLGLLGLICWYFDRRSIKRKHPEIE